jgi:hypothetical protein
VIEAMGIRTLRADTPADVAPTVEAALSMAFAGGSANVVLLGQRLVGAKDFMAEDRR